MKIYLNFGTIILSKHKKKLFYYISFLYHFMRSKILDNIILKKDFNRPCLLFLQISYLQCVELVHGIICTFEAAWSLTQIYKCVYHSYLWISTLANEQCSICRQKVVLLMYSSFCIDLIILWIRHFHCVSFINHKSRLHYHKS